MGRSQYVKLPEHNKRGVWFFGAVSKHKMFIVVRNSSILSRWASTKGKLMLA